METEETLVVVYIDCINDYLHKEGKRYDADYASLPLKEMQIFVSEEKLISLFISTEHHPLDQDPLALYNTFGAMFIEGLVILSDQLQLKKPAESPFYASSFDHYLRKLQSQANHPLLLLFIGPNSDLAVKEALLRDYNSLKVDRNNVNDIIAHYPKRAYFENS